MVALTDLDSSSKYYGLWFSRFSLVSFANTTKDSEKPHICRIVASVICIFFLPITHSWIRGKQEWKGAVKKIICVLKCVKREIFGLVNFCLIYIKKLNHRHAIQIEIFKTVVNNGMMGITTPWVFPSGFPITVENDDLFVSLWFQEERKYYIVSDKAVK